MHKRSQMWTQMPIRTIFTKVQGAENQIFFIMSHTKKCIYKRIKSLWWSIYNDHTHKESREKPDVGTNANQMPSTIFIRRILFLIKHLFQTPVSFAFQFFLFSFFFAECQFNCGDNEVGARPCWEGEACHATAIHFAKTFQRPSAAAAVQSDQWRL